MLVFFSLDGLIILAVVIVVLACGGIHEGVLYFLSHPYILILFTIFVLIVSLLLSLIDKRTVSEIIFRVVASLLFCLAVFSWFKDLDHLYSMQGGDFNDEILLFIKRAIYIMSTVFIVLFHGSALMCVHLTDNKGEHFLSVLTIISYVLFIVATALITCESGFLEWLIMAVSGCLSAFTTSIMADSE